MSMKKNFTLTLVLLLTSFFLVTGQTQRKVLLEHFTQASCGPCATYNPAVQAIINANPTKLTSIKYQTSWPGYDPMNQHNPTQVANRVSYYPPSFGVPNSQIDGSYFRGHPANWNIGTINTRYAMPSPFFIEISHSLSPLKDSIRVKMTVRAAQSVTGTLVGHIVVVEEKIIFANPPGTNGEKEFHSVMKRMLPSADGTTLPTSFGVGDSVVIQQAWKLANVYDVEELAVVGFVQDNATKIVHQAEYSPPLPPAPMFTRDVSVLSMENLPKSSCWGKVTPVVSIKNLGGDTLKTLEFHMQANNETVQVYNWTGNLPFYAEATINLPELAFAVQNANQIRVYTSNPNGQPDELPASDTASGSIPKAATATQVVTFTLRTDNFPAHTTWQLTDAYNNVLYNGGPYAQAQTFYRDTFNLPATGCFTFTINDAGGDGICCATGTGFYRLTDANNVNFVTGGTFKHREISEFDLGNSIGIEDKTGHAVIEVYPNPFKDAAQVRVELRQAMTVEMTLYNLLGKQVATVQGGFKQAGSHQMVLPSNDLPGGLYILRVRTGDQDHTFKMQLVR